MSHLQTCLREKAFFAYGKILPFWVNKAWTLQKENWADLWRNGTIIICTATIEGVFSKKNPQPCPYSNQGISRIWGSEDCLGFHLKFSACEYLCFSVLRVFFIFFISVFELKGRGCLSFESLKQRWNVSPIPIL